MVPLDVANSRFDFIIDVILNKFRGDGGGLDMDLFWKIILIADMVMLVVLIPFGIFRYEGDEEASFVYLSSETSYNFIVEKNNECNMLYYCYNNLFWTFDWHNFYLFK